VSQRVPRCTERLVTRTVARRVGFLVLTIGTPGVMRASRSRAISAAISARS
jgi:hypothetical protein